MATVMSIPERYFKEDVLNFVTEESIRDYENMPVGLRFFYDKNLVTLTDKKAMWSHRPKRRYVQVYSVQILSDEPDLIYGTIEVDSHLVFNREVGHGSNDHVIDKHGFVRLNGPHSPLRVTSFIVVHPKLYRGNQLYDFYNLGRGVEIQNDEEGLLIPYEDIPVLDLPGLEGIYLSIPRHETRPLDKLLFEDAKTTCGTMRVSYAILSDAADSYMTMKLLKWRGGDSAANVYGTISMYDTRITEKGTKSLVFGRDKDEETLSIKPGQYIPLQRPMNAVSMGYSLKLEFKLFHKSGDSSADDLLILSKQFSTEAKCYSEDNGPNGITECHKIGGKHCMFEISFYWLPYWSLPSRD